MDEKLKIIKALVEKIERMSGMTEYYKTIMEDETDVDMINYYENAIEKNLEDLASVKKKLYRVAMM